MKKLRCNHLVKLWENCGIEEGDVLLVHSSLKKFLHKMNTEIGTTTPMDVYESLLLAIGDKGTLILPTYNFDFKETKVFDIKNTPSKMGVLTRIGMEYADLRTPHPFYSFAIRGYRVKEFADIDGYSAFGDDSVFGKMREMGGKIAVIGLDSAESMTSIHHTEEVIGVPWEYRKEFEGKVILENEETLTKVCSINVRKPKYQVESNRFMELSWDSGIFKGDRTDEGYFTRTCTCKDLYELVKKVIEDDAALLYLLSIKSDWFEIDQERINNFASITLDWQYIHISKYKDNIAHGFLTLSLLTHLGLDREYVPEGTETIINYGFDRVRFLNPVKVNSKIQNITTLKEKRKKGKNILMKIENKIMLEDGKIALIADWLVLFVMEDK